MMKDRRLRVRQSYPEPIVELACSLAGNLHIDDVSRMLDIPRSALYRWRAMKKPCWPLDAIGGANTKSIAALVACCSEFGFDFSEQVHEKCPSALFAKTRREGMSEEVVPACSDARARISTVCVDVNASQSSQITAARRNNAGTRRKYTFDIHKERASRQVRHRLEAAKQEMDNKYFLELDCRTLAGAAQMSRYHFIRMFRDLLGMTPYRYLMHVRVEAAKKLLLCSREPIEVIATAVGFASGPALNRAFKQIEGVCASEFYETSEQVWNRGKIHLEP